MAIISKQQELDLALDAKAGNPESFGRLYDIYIKKIYDFIYYKTLNDEQFFRTYHSQIQVVLYKKQWNALVDDLNYLKEDEKEKMETPSTADMLF